MAKVPYINRLQDENAALREQLEAARRAVIDMQSYLQSSKFHGPENDYVHVSTDINPKLSELRNMLLV